MNIVLKLCAAGLTCAVIAAGTIAAHAEKSPLEAAASTIGASGAPIMLALNPQPLPPGYHNDDEDDYFRG